MAWRRDAIDDVENEGDSPGTGGTSTGRAADQYADDDSPLGFTSGEMARRETQNLPPDRFAQPGYSTSPNYMEHAPKRVRMFYAGDEYAPMNSPQAIPRIHMLLIAAGLLDPKKARTASWDEESADAYRKVLELANRYGVGANQMLNMLATDPSIAGMEQAAGGAGAEAPVIELTNPAELRESFRQTFRDRVGYNPSQSAMDAFVTSYHGIEQSKQKALNDAAPGSTFVQGPSAETEAGEEVRRQYAAEEQAYSTITRMNDFYEMLGPIA